MLSVTTKKRLKNHARSVRCLKVPESIALSAVNSCDNREESWCRRNIISMESIPPVYSSATERQNKTYTPPWADLSIIGIAGSSGSGKTSVAMEIIKSLNLPWVVILVMVRSTFIDLDTDKEKRNV